VTRASVTSSVVGVMETVVTDAPSVAKPVVEEGLE
jgi:hypothetical protein